MTMKREKPHKRTKSDTEKNTTECGELIIKKKTFPNAQDLF